MKLLIYDLYRRGVSCPGKVSSFAKRLFLPAWPQKWGFPFHAGGVFLKKFVVLHLTLVLIVSRHSRQFELPGSSHQLPYQHSELSAGCTGWISRSLCPPLKHFFGGLWWGSPSESKATTHCVERDGGKVTTFKLLQTDGLNTPPKERDSHRVLRDRAFLHKYVFSHWICMSLLFFFPI